ncbi:MCE family protein [Amycolatopsis nigrescens]|uniref:MCE family protein n=1 Tax=Amycolatopsis nigrescens TaxID=381445 RepID=UPI00037B23F9|nr:MCE family protein [Amycolatopsis nigrescens]
MKPFRERNLTVLGVLATTVVALAVLATLNFERLPLLGGTTYAAEFTEAAGLDDAAEVRVTGVKVGEVSDVELEGDHIRVEFTARDTAIGDRTVVSIEIKTLLGQKYLSLSPAGDTPQNPDRPIPRDRTRTPYDLGTLVDQLGSTVQQVDSGQLAGSFRVLAETFAGSPQHVRDALDGLSAMSRTISSRDDELAKLLRNTSQVAGTVADRDAEFRTLLTDGQALLGEVQRRKDAISRLLTATTGLAGQLRGLVADNQQRLTPALTELGKVTDLLQRNQDNLTATIKGFAPLVRTGANTFGNGRWAEVYMCGLLPPNVNLGPLSVNPQGCLPPNADGGPK